MDHRRDAYHADLALLFQTLQRGEMSLPVYHVVYLKKVYVVGIEQLKGIGNLILAFLFAFAPHFGRKVEVVPLALRGDADYLLCVAMHGGATIRFTWFDIQLSTISWQTAMSLSEFTSKALKVPRPIVETSRLPSFRYSNSNYPSLNLGML